MNMRRLFLTLLTIIALTFPGMSVCATELQTDETESGEEADQSLVDTFNSDEIFYYNPDSAKMSDTEEIIAQLLEENLAQKQQILDMEDALQFEKEQRAAIQGQMNLLCIGIVGMFIVLIGLIIYSFRKGLIFRTDVETEVNSDSATIKIIEFKRH